MIFAPGEAPAECLCAACELRWQRLVSKVGDCLCHAHAVERILAARLDSRVRSRLSVMIMVVIVMYHNRDHDCRGHLAGADR
jgi:hypothetical protein